MVLLNEQEKHYRYYTGMILVSVIAFPMALFFYDIFARQELDYYIFGKTTLSKLAGKWSTALKCAVALSYSSISTLMFHILEKDFWFYFALNVSLALVFGALGMVILSLSVATIVASLLTVILLLALFFGPGDR